jgi:hypothetical protein
VATVIDGDFEWDDVRHARISPSTGVSFEEAAWALADPNVVIVDDGSGSDRLLGIGASRTAQLLCVVHIERGERDRIISARAAGPEHHALYSERG